MKFDPHLHPWSVTLDVVTGSFTRAVLTETGSPWLNRDERNLAAWLQGQGMDVEWVLLKHLERGRVTLDRSTLVAGGIPTMRAALRVLGGDLPAPDDYPMVLRDHLHRRLWSSTVGALRHRLDSGEGLPVFAKPKPLKRFTGQVFADPDDRAALSGVSDRLGIWCTEVVAWRSEWRVFVADGDVLDRRHYHGEPWTEPDPAVVADCVARLAGDPCAPAAYGIDIGILADGRTALVECNDGFALGTYGLAPEVHARVLVTRWRQLLAQL